MVFALTDRDKLKYMLRCLELARNTPSATKYPLVGALILSSEGEVVGEGYKTPLQEPEGKFLHAERNALEQALLRTEGSILFTTLEPCLYNHDERAKRRKRWKSCAELIVESKISKVIYGIVDTESIYFEPLEGIIFLKNNGVDVEHFSRLEDKIMPFYKMKGHTKKKGLST